MVLGVVSVMSVVLGGVTHHIDKLYESQAKGHLDLLGHVLHGADELVIAAEEVTHQPLLITGPHS